VTFGHRKKLANTRGLKYHSSTEILCNENNNNSKGLWCLQIQFLHFNNTKCWSKILWPYYSNCKRKLLKFFRVCLYHYFFYFRKSFFRSTRLSFIRLRPYYKSKLELNSRAKFYQSIACLPVFIFFFFALKVRFKGLKFEFCQFKLE